MSQTKVKQQQINRLENLFKNVINSGYSVNDLKSMSVKEYNLALDKKITSETSLKAQFRLLDQIKNNLNQVEKTYFEKRSVKNTVLIEAVKSESKRIFAKVKKPEKKEVITKQLELPIPKKEGKYGVAEIKVSKDKSYWIKYNSKKDLNRQLDIIKGSFQIKEFTPIFHGIRKYVEFIDDEFKDLLERKGVKI